MIGTLPDHWGCGCQGNSCGYVNFCHPTMLRVEQCAGEPPHQIIQQANNVLYQDLSRADSFVTRVCGDH